MPPYSLDSILLSMCSSFGVARESFTAFALVNRFIHRLIPGCLVGYGHHVGNPLFVGHRLPVVLVSGLRCWLGELPEEEDDPQRSCRPRTRSTPRKSPEFEPELPEDCLEPDAVPDEESAFSPAPAEVCEPSSVAGAAGSVAVAAPAAASSAFASVTFSPVLAAGVFESAFCSAVTPPVPASAAWSDTTPMPDGADNKSRGDASGRDLVRSQERQHAAALLLGFALGRILLGALRRVHRLKHCGLFGGRLRDRISLHDVDPGRVGNLSQVFLFCHFDTPLSNARQYL